MTDRISSTHLTPLGQTKYPTHHTRVSIENLSSRGRLSARNAQRMEFLRMTAPGSLTENSCAGPRGTPPGARTHPASAPGTWGSPPCGERDAHAHRRPLCEKAAPTPPPRSCASAGDAIRVIPLSQQRPPLWGWGTRCQAIHVTALRSHAQASAVRAPCFTGPRGGEGRRRDPHPPGSSATARSLVPSPVGESLAHRDRAGGV